MDGDRSAQDKPQVIPCDEETNVTLVFFPSMLDEHDILLASSIRTMRASGMARKHYRIVS